MGESRQGVRRKAGLSAPRYTAALKALDAAGANAVLELDGHAVTLTRLDKILWTAKAKTHAYTRRDYVRYLLRAAPYMLPHMADRPLTLIRQPEGIDGRRFVHFHYEHPLPDFVEGVSIYSEKNRRAEPYLLCNNAATLLWLAHVGSLEFHVWHSRTSPKPDAKGANVDFTSSLEALEKSILSFPDYLVVDLDPYIYSGGEAKGGQPEFNEAAWEKCKAVAFELKDLLDSMKLESLVKTSGKTGLHVLVPLVRTIDYTAVRALAETLGKHLMRLHPGLITMQQSAGKRTGRIFFDHGMNARVKTLIAPYSPRGIAGAPVSMPVTWKALKKASPLDYTMANTAELLDRHGDIWADIFGRKQQIERVLAGC